MVHIIMGQGRGKFTKVVKKSNVKVRQNLNISKHPKVYRETPNYTTTVNRQGLSHTTGVHGAAYGVHKNRQDRIIQQKHRTATVNVVHKVRHIVGGGNVRTHVPVVIKKHQAKQHQIKQGAGVVKTGTKVIQKKKYVRPIGAGQNPVYLNPFGLDSY